MSLPERRYDLAGPLLAAALGEAERIGESPRAVLDRRARELGTELGGAARAAHPADNPGDAVFPALESYGFEPHAAGEHIVLGNCPFHTLARQHTELVCGTNLCLLDGLLNGSPPPVSPRTSTPTPDQCCVRLERTDRPAQPT